MAHRVLLEENNSTGKPARSGRRFCSWMLKLFAAACVLQAVAMLSLHHRLGQIEPRWHGKLPFKKPRALLVDMEAPSTDSLSEHIRQALSEPIRIATMAGIFYSGNVLGMVPNCTFRDTGEELRCAWFDGIRYEESADVADAWYYDIAAMEEPAVYRDVQSRPLSVLAVIKSEGSATRYPDLDDQLFMDQFDIEMDYRMCAHVRTPAPPILPLRLQQLLTTPAPPLNEKVEGIAFLADDCSMLGSAFDLVQAIVDTKKMRVGAYGKCLHNLKVNARVSNRQIFSQYKFCLAPEQGLARDFFTGAVYEQLLAGCVPIYLGASNVNDFVPGNSVVSIADYDSVEEMMEEVARLARNDTAYEEMMAWKGLPFEKQPAAFQRHIADAYLSSRQSQQCRLCNQLMEYRLAPGSIKRLSHCLRNETWLQRGSSSWTDSALGLQQAQRLWGEAMEKLAQQRQQEAEQEQQQGHEAHLVQEPQLHPVQQARK